MTEVPVLVRNEDIDIGTSYVIDIKTLQSSEIHTDVTAYNLSEIRSIRLVQNTRTLKHTAQKFFSSTVIPLDSRYRMDIVSTIKKLQGKWSYESMNGRCKSLDGNQYYQAFVKNAYFDKV